MNRVEFLGAVLFALIPILNGCAQQPKAAIKADAITVSGRESLPNAEGSALKGLLSVRDVKVSAELLKNTQDKDIEQTLITGLMKSLRNYGYEATGSTANAIPLDVIIDLKIGTPAANTKEALAKINISAADTGHPLAGCAGFESQATFTALPYRSVSDGAQALAWISGLALIIADPINGGGSAATFVMDQTKTADINDKVFNASNGGFAIDSGVPDQPGDRAASQYAATNAIRLVIARYITDLNQKVCSSGS